jgi:tol-pal system protein YbgF
LGIDLRGDLARGPDQAEYRSGLEAYQRGDYPSSVQSLRNFVSRNRGSALAPYAHYWIGEAYFSQGKYYEAILAYNEIPTSWPENDRVPAAKLRQAEAFAASGDLQDARIYLKELIEKYPGTPEAAEAQQRLRSL